MKGDKRRSGKETQVFMLARLFLQAPEIYLDVCVNTGLYVVSACWCMRECTCVVCWSESAGWLNLINPAHFDQPTQLKHISLLYINTEPSFHLVHSQNVKNVHKIKTSLLTGSKMKLKTLKLLIMWPAAESQLQM